MEEKTKLITDRETFYERLLELLKEGDFTFMNILTGKVIYFRESFPDNGEVMVDEGFGETDRYLLNIAHIAVFKPDPRGVNQVMEDLLQGWVKPLVVLLLMMIPMFVNAQVFTIDRDKPPSAVYVLFQPTDLGFGVRGDYHFNHWAGIYGSGSYGAWRMYKHSGLGDHVKLTLGALIPYKDYMGNQHDFSIGLNYHWTSGYIIPNEDYRNHWAFDNPWSFELGFTIKMQRITLAFRTDILRWEPCIDIGIPLNFKSRYRKHKVVMPKR